MSTELIPIGVRPKWVWQLERANDLAGAISRYAQGGYEIDPEWISEYNDLVEVLSNQPKRKHLNEDGTFITAKQYNNYKK